tara:strand:- start:1799 stop:4222 length:2424 start_codon:yes stop_codon:yes gene_type:complete
MDFGNNIKVIDINDLEYSIIVTKYRKLCTNKLFKKYLSDYHEKTNSYKLYKRSYINNILYYENNNLLYVYFKKYYISTINFNNNIDFKETIKNIINTIKKIIIKNNIKLTIQYIFDILELNIDKIDKSLLDSFSKSFIEFSIVNNNIIFYVKNNKFLKCKKNELYNCINNILYSRYKEIELSKRKILFCSHSHKIFNNKDFIYDLIKQFFINGYWLDFLACHNYSSDYKIINVKTHPIVLLKYDIIIYEGSTIANLLCLNIKIPENKLIIRLPSSYSYDMNKAYYILNKEKCVHFGIRNLDKPTRAYLTLWAVIRSQTFHRYKKDFFSKLKLFDSNNIKYSVLNNDSFLDRKDFFKIHNLDVNKKLVTIFIEWPQLRNSELEIKHQHTVKNYSYPFFKHKKIIWMERMICSEKFSGTFKKIIKSFENNNCNVIFKIHPTSNAYIINNTIYIVGASFDNIKRQKDQVWCENTKKHFDIHLFDKDFGIKPLIDRYTFVDQSFHSEIMEYTDYGIMFGPTTCGWFNYIYDFPMMAISDKKYDWFPFMFKTDEYLKERKKMITVNNLMTSDGRIVFYNENINKDKSYKLNDDVDVKIDDLYCIEDIFYGEYYYWDDIINDNEIVNNFLSKDFKKDYKFFDNNPLYGNSYNSDHNDTIKTVLDLISTTDIVDTSNDINMILDDKFFTVYAQSYINVILNNNKEIIIKIIQEPIKNNNFINYGISIEVSYHKDKPNVILEFDCKFDINEENVFPRVYTGRCWKILTIPLTNKYQKFNITNEIFDFENNSKWRLSTTSKLKDQQIFFKNINFKI